MPQGLLEGGAHDVIASPRHSPLSDSERQDHVSTEELKQEEIPQISNNIIDLEVVPGQGSPLWLPEIAYASS